MNYYNEFDPHAAAWLRELIESGQILPGEVDERSIEDVRPADLEGFTQCHFFAGIGGWPLALQLAGWPADRPVWTGSCPCQPFSAAGRRGGTDDERHLWPAFRWLIDQCRPPAVFGEQVASKAGREWLTGVQTDLQAMGFDTAGADLCAAGVGAPHIRQRLWWVGHADGMRPERERRKRTGGASEPGGDSGMADTERSRRHNGRRVLGRCGQESERGEKAERGEQGQQAERDGSSDSLRALWTEANFIPCADGKARRIEPGTQPLVNGVPRGVVPSSDPGAPGYAENTGEARKMRLYGYGNAIVPQVAAVFIRAAGGAA